MRTTIAVVILVFGIIGIIGGIIYLNAKNGQPLANSQTTTSPSSELPTDTVIATTSTSGNGAIFTGLLNKIYTKDNKTLINLSINSSGKTYSQDFIIAVDNTNGLSQLRVQNTTQNIAPVSSNYKDFSFPSKTFAQKLSSYVNHVVSPLVIFISTPDPSTKNPNPLQLCNQAFIENITHKIAVPVSCSPFITQLSVYSPNLK